MAGPFGARKSALASLTSFVGREEQIAQVRAALEHDRLVSLLGVGGVGKSRLAAAVAEQHDETAAERTVATVELGSVLEPAFVAQAIHDAVDPHGNQQASLAEAIGARRLLLVLDGCEHLAAQVALLLAELLARCPGLRILATSRVPLGVEGERLVHVPPLSLTPAEDDKLSAAARLFQTRARAVVGPVDPEDHDAVEELCRRLDGLPLAIELAASRTRTMTVWEMLESITDWTAVLRPHPSAAEHRSLEAVLQWSWDHCGVAERQLWAQLSVFTGPITLPAAMAVCGFGDQFMAAEAIDSLVQRSLLLRETQHKSTTFRMLDTIAAFGRRSFTASSPPISLTYEQLQSRHARYYAQLGSTLSDEWLGPNQTQLSQSTRINIANFRAAFDHLILSPEDSVRAVEMYADLWPYWIGCGRLRESHTWIQRLVERGYQPHARAMCIAGWTELLLGNTDAAVRHLTASLSTNHDDPRTGHLSRSLLAACRALAGDFAAATSEYQNSIAQLEAAGDELIAALLWENYAELAIIFGDLNLGREASARAQRICRAHREQWVLSWLVWVEALASYLEGDFDQAITHAGEAWSIKATLDDLLGAAVVAEVAAWAYASRGETGTAAKILGATAQYWTGTDGPLLGFRELLHHRQQCLARVRRTLGDDERRTAARFGAAVGLFGLVDHLGQATEPDKALEQRPVELLGVKSEILTPREREIATYVRAGLTNKEIAEQLTVSVRTVEAHVSQILTKLRVARRSGIAAALA